LSCGQVRAMATHSSSVLPVSRSSEACTEANHFCWRSVRCGESAIRSPLAPIVPPLAAIWYEALTTSGVRHELGRDLRRRQQLREDPARRDARGPGVRGRPRLRLHGRLPAGEGAYAGDPEALDGAQPAGGGARAAL